MLFERMKNWNESKSKRKHDKYTNDELIFNKCVSKNTKVWRKEEEEKKTIIDDEICWWNFNIHKLIYLKQTNKKKTLHLLYFIFFLSIFLSGILKFNKQKIKINCILKLLLPVLEIIIVYVPTYIRTIHVGSYINGYKLQSKYLHITTDIVRLFVHKQTHTINRRHKWKKRHNTTKNKDNFKKKYASIAKMARRKKLKV